MIDDNVFLTASHCTAGLEAEGITDVFVTFAPEWDEQSTSTRGTFSGTMFTHPDFASGGANDTFDIAVVVLDKAPRVTPAQLPTAGLLDQMKSSGAFEGQDFTAVGYGTVRDDKRTGPHAFFFDGIRRFALQSFMSLQSAWLNLSMQPSTGDGGTCFGDSGGPHFLGDETSNFIVSITITGDAMCRATDKTYRLDTPSARNFLDDFVTLP